MCALFPRVYILGKEEEGIICTETNNSTISNFVGELERVGNRRRERGYISKTYNELVLVMVVVMLEGVRSRHLPCAHNNDCDR